jgi:hypothetical protein
LHDGVNELLRKVHGYKGGLQEFPFQTIIGFSHVSLNPHKAILSVCLRKVVKDFICYQGVVSDESARNKGTLVERYDFMEDCF